MDDFKCKECCKQFSQFCSLRKHVKKYHENRLNELAPLKHKSYKFKCEQCGNNFNKISHLRFHQKKRHGIAAESSSLLKSSKKCPMCDFQNSFKKQLFAHFETAHDIKIISEEIEFSTLVDFNKWKESVEKETKSRFVLERGRSSGKTEILNYICHRSGKYISESKGSRHLKTQGTCKINGFCPAGVKVIMTAGNKFKVHFVKSHIGHQNDIDHLSLTLPERQLLATKLSSGIPFTVILDEIRDSISGSNLERIHLLTKKDLYNIKNAFNLHSTAVRHQNDASSVEAWVNEMKGNGCVLFYKPKDETLEEHPELNGMEWNGIRNNFTCSDAEATNVEDNNLLYIQLNNEHQDQESSSILKELIKNTPVRPTSETDCTLLLNRRKEILKLKFNETINNIASLEELEIVEKFVTPIAPALAAVKSKTKPMQQVTTRTPHNKKIATQRLFKTKHKPKRRGNSLKKPDESECQAVALDLLHNRHSR